MTARLNQRIPLNVLVVEDSEEDCDLLVLELRRGGYDPKHLRVDDPEALQAALDEQLWDLILCDYSMPRLTLADALAAVKAHNLEIPFLIVSATIGEDAAVSAIKAGAHDYILKHNLVRLIPAVDREIRESRERRERRHLEEQLREIQKLESLGVLAGGVAHDFNNLLTGILGNASLVLELWSPPKEARQLLDDVVCASDRAAELTRQLLAYAGKGRFFLEPIDLPRLTREILGLITASIPKNVEVVVNLDRQLPAVLGDSSQIQQIIMNLVLNAAEAIGDAGGVVVLSARAWDISADTIHTFFPGSSLEPGRCVTIEVQDDGCGMDESTKSRIFEPFFTTKFTGRGLGLAAVQGIVRTYRGAIRVDSSPGAGSRFQVVLPAMADSAHPLGEIPPPERAEFRGTGTILVVDDEDFVRRAAKSGLEYCGYRVIEAKNGADALRLFEAIGNELRIVLLDLSMPVLGGETAYRRMRDLRPEIPVIISSGYGEREISRLFGTHEKITFLQKPYTSERLAKAVHRVLGSNGVTRELG